MSGLFEPELQYWDIKGPQEIDLTRIPEFPASDLLQSIAGQNLKGAAFEVLLQNQEKAQQADQRNQAFYSLAQQTGIPAAQLSPMAIWILTSLVQVPTGDQRMSTRAALSLWFPHKASQKRPKDGRDLRRQLISMP